MNTHLWIQGIGVIFVFAVLILTIMNRRHLDKVIASQVLSPEGHAAQLAQAEERFSRLERTVVNIGNDRDQLQALVVELKLQLAAEEIRAQRLEGEVASITQKRDELKSELDFIVSSCQRIGFAAERMLGGGPDKVKTFNLGLAKLWVRYEPERTAEAKHASEEGPKGTDGRSFADDCALALLVDGHGDLPAEWQD